MATARYRIAVMASTAAVAAAAAVPWPSPAISWWYAADNNWPSLLTQIAPYTGNATAPSLVTSIQTYCGLSVADNGSIIDVISDACLQLFPALRAVGVRPELALDSGNCSIDAYRQLWSDTTVSPGVLLSAALAANASGVNVDLEPQADNCQGPATGTPADATLFAAWLAAVRAALNPHGIRVTVDAATWSPVIGQYSVLAASVDRVMTMETYNGDSEAQWLTWYRTFVGAVPRAAAGVGLGAWSDGGSAWWETAAGAAAKVSQAMADGVPELAVFRLLPPAEYPLPFWWAALTPFVAGR